MGGTPGLLPCPFCGEDPWYEERMDEDIATHNQVVWKSVACPNDCARIEIPDDYEGGTAVERWNRREAADALIEAERRGAERMREGAAELAGRLWHHTGSEASPDYIADGIRALPLTKGTPDADA